MHRSKPESGFLMIDKGYWIFDVGLFIGYPALDFNSGSLTFASSVFRQTFLIN